MSSTSMVIPMPMPSRICRLLATVAVLTLSSAHTAGAFAAVPWHHDLAAARRASEISHRPVLAIFTASWSSASTTLDRTTLASDEAVALITACFEPVCVDVDTHPEATRRLGITKVPTACILSADDKALSKFELPETPAGFVAAAARAAQEAAFASATRSSGQGTAMDSSASHREFADISENGSGTLPSFGGEGGKAMRSTAPTDIRGTVPPGGKAINAVAAKVRMLSDFASDEFAPTSGSESAIAASFRETNISTPTAPPVAPPVMAPTAAPPTAVATTLVPDAAVTPPEMLDVAQAAAGTPTPTTPTPTSPAPTTSATLAANSAFGSTATQTPLSIEPTPTTPAAPSQATARAAPWLGLPQQNQPVTPVKPEPTAAVAAMPAAGSSSTAAAAGFQSLADARATAAPQLPTAPQPAAPQPAAPQPAAAQPATPEQPNAGGSGTALAETKPPKPSMSSSLLSALQKPFSMFSSPTAAKTAPSSTVTAANAPAQDTAALATPAEPDLYGSMPVGLEGYCPVTLAERGVWVEGRAQWGARHRGRTYLFASAEQQKAFLADPDRYAPALSGDDPVMAFDAGKCTPGQRRYGVTYQSRTYLFSSTETRDAFAANPQRYTSGAVVAENRRPANGPVIR